MTDNSPESISWRPPLIFSLTLGAIAGIVVLVVSTGGSSRSPRFDLAGGAAAIAFAASLLLSTVLILAAKPNKEELGQGSGINRTITREPARKETGQKPAGNPDGSMTATGPMDALDADSPPHQTEP